MSLDHHLCFRVDSDHIDSGNANTKKKKINGDRNVNSMKKIALVTVVTVLMMVLLLLLSRFSRIQLCVTPETAAHQAPPSLGC